MLLLDRYFMNMFENFDLCYSVPGINEPFEISGNITLPDPAISQMANFLHADNYQGMKNKKELFN